MWSYEVNIIYMYINYREKSLAFIERSLPFFLGNYEHLLRQYNIFIDIERRRETLNLC